MVAALTHGKKGLEERRDFMEEAGGRCQRLKDDLLRAMDRDTEAFDRVMACFRMPKKTDEQKRARAAAVEAAVKQATLVPLGTLETCPDLLDLCERVAALGNPSSLSDAGVAGLMARAAALGAYYNVLINLAGIEDREWRRDVLRRADEALERADRGGREVQDSVLGRLRAALQGE
jgi:glutamate formiminotransferase/formiminotetrahydrofolate cyclodeaminase